jgi:hypothetical protein
MEKRKEEVEEKKVFQKKNIYIYNGISKVEEKKMMEFIYYYLF